MGEEHGEHRVDGDDDGGQTGVGHHNANLEQGHAETDIDHAQSQQIDPVARRQMVGPPLQILQGEGQQDETADEKAEKGELECGKSVSGDFQRDFHGAKGEGGQQDK